MRGTTARRKAKLNTVKKPSARLKETRPAKKTKRKRPEAPEEPQRDSAEETPVLTSDGPLNPPPSAAPGSGRDKRATTVVEDDHVALVSASKIDALLDAPTAEIHSGVFIAPLFRGHWGASAQIQIEAGKCHGPHVNTAEFLVGRILVGTAPDNSQEGVLAVRLGSGAEEVLGQDDYFQVAKGETYTLRNRSAIQPVLLALQVFTQPACAKATTEGLLADRH